MHHMRFFDIRITQPTSLRKNGTNATTLTVAFQAKAGEEGFQIYVAPIIGTKITEERFMMGEPFGCAQRPDRNIGRFDAVMGQTYEVWFIKGDFLYEVSTYKRARTWAQRNNVHLAIYINP